jgi:Uma2 family endonuclease
MAGPRRLHHTYAEYLEVEALSSVRHEYLDGEIYAMAGGAPEHGILAGRLAALLGNQLPTRCRVASSDVEIAVVATGLATYPDLSVSCGPLARDSRDPLAVTNPVLLVEVTSNSTEDYDRGDKLSHYRQIEGLQGVLLVSHRGKRITAVTREGTEWVTRDYRGGERVVLASPAVELAVDDVYAVLDGL